MSESQPGPRTSGNKTIVILFVAGAIILAVGVVLLVMKGSAPEPEPEKPAPVADDEPVAPAPLVVAAPEKPKPEQEDAGAEPAVKIEEEETDDQPKQPRGGGGGGGGPQGTIDAAATNKYINARFAQVRQCYERRLKINPLLQGKVDLKIRVTNKGKVASVGVNRDEVGDAQMIQCIKRTIRGWKLPPPDGGWAVFDKAFRFKKAN